jgi:hypothetical protein
MHSPSTSNHNIENSPEFSAAAAGSVRRPPLAVGLARTPPSGGLREDHSLLPQEWALSRSRGIGACIWLSIRLHRFREDHPSFLPAGRPAALSDGRVEAPDGSGGGVEFRAAFDAVPSDWRLKVHGEIAVSAHSKAALSSCSSNFGPITPPTRSLSWYASPAAGTAGDGPPWAASLEGRFPGRRTLSGDRAGLAKVCGVTVVTE